MGETESCKHSNCHTHCNPLLMLEPFNIFALYAAANAALLLFLSIIAVTRRLALGVSVGDAGNQKLTRAVRAHGNASEYIPIGLLLLLACVQSGAPPWFLHAVGASLTLGRVFHALGLHSSTGLSFGRTLGMVLTWTSMILGIVGPMYFLALAQ